MRLLSRGSGNKRGPGKLLLGQNDGHQANHYHCQAVCTLWRVNKGSQDRNRWKCEAAQVHWQHVSHLRPGCSCMTVAPRKHISPTPPGGSFWPLSPKMQTSTLTTGRPQDVGRAGKSSAGMTTLMASVSLEGMPQASPENYNKTIHRTPLPLLACAHMRFTYQTSSKQQATQHCCKTISLNHSERLNTPKP